MDQPVLSAMAPIDTEGEALPRRRRRRLVARSNTGLYIGGVILLVVLICMLVPGLITPGDPLALDLSARLLGPGASGHPLGTDPLGRDVLQR